MTNGMTDDQTTQDPAAGDAAVMPEVPAEAATGEAMVDDMGEEVDEEDMDDAE